MISKCDKKSPEFKFTKNVLFYLDCVYMIENGGSKQLQIPLRHCHQEIQVLLLRLYHVDSHQANRLAKEPLSYVSGIVVNDP